MKNKLISLLAIMIFLNGCSGNNLPKAQPGSNFYGEMFGVDKNINIETIDRYLDRKDVAYRDVRMLIDEADYQAIGGDSFFSGFIRGFSVIPFPFLAPLTGLPDEVGQGYQGETLFTADYQPRYKESMMILEYLFPKDKAIFLMCGGGGYAGMNKTMLVALGWNSDKVYNVGGYWFYEGNNNINVKRIDDQGNTVYDFWKVNYHDIDFSNLERII